MVRDFDVIEDRSLAEALDDIRAIGGSAWGNLQDPVATHLAERSGVRGAR